MTATSTPSPRVRAGCAITMLALAGFGGLCSGLNTLAMFTTDAGYFTLAFALSTAVALPYLLVLLWIDRHEPEPWWLVAAALAWGAIGATGLSAFGNDLFTASLVSAGASKGAASVATASLSAPLVEETAKGLALLAMLAVFRRELHGVVDGVLYGALIGLGFEWMENAWYYMRQHDAGALAMATLAVERGVLGTTGTHAAWTAVTGAAVGWWRANPTRPTRWLLLPLGWWTAASGHFLWNTFARAFFTEDAGYVDNVLAYARAALVLQTPSLLFLAIILRLAWRHEDDLLRACLADEPPEVVAAGDVDRLVPARHRHRRALAAWRAGGPSAGLRRRALAQVLIRLAFTRWALRVDEAADASALAPLRDEARRLRLEACRLRREGATL